MASKKMKYGIHLGNDYAAISRMENGEPVIVKTDTLKNVMPSCVSVTRHGTIIVGDAAINILKSQNAWKNRPDIVYTNFVRMLGTDITLPCSYLGRDLTPIDLCADVLKALKSFITDDNIDSAVITVPAKFTVNQKTATMQAAKLAGFDHCELLQEPIAASMAYGLSSAQKDGIFMLFNFNYTSFDASLIKIENGIMQVFDTEGDNYMGGKNLDEAIVDKLIIPYLQANYSIDGLLADKQKSQVLREALRAYANDARNQLSNRDSADVVSGLNEFSEDENGDEIELDLTLIQSQVFNVMRPVFQKAVDVCLKLIRRNNLSVEQLRLLQLVGSDTQSPLIRQMLSEQITPKVHTRTDPMTAVATGAALYASTIDAEEPEKDIKQDTIRLDVSYSSITIESTEWISIRLLDNSIDSVLVELVRGDEAWSSGKMEINAMGDVIEAQLLEGKPNLFTIVAYDHRGNRLPCQPNEITIIHHNGFAPATLPYSFAVQDREGIMGFVNLRTITGLEKNKPLPAMGRCSHLKTTSQLRPGSASDIIRIPIYQTDFDSGNKSIPAFLHECVADIIITGEDVPKYISNNSTIDLTVKVDRSEMIQAKIFFPDPCVTIENANIQFKKQSLTEVQAINELEIIIAQLKLQLLEKDGVELSILKSHLDLIASEFEYSSDPKRVHQHIIELLRELYKINN